MADDLLGLARDRTRLNHFWQYLGIDVVDVREGWARLRVRVRDELRNAPGAPVHGAVYAALVDAAVGCALSTVNEASGGGVGQTTLDLNVTYLAAARGPEIYAEGTLLKRGRTIAFGDVRVTDADGTPVAVGRATYMVLAPRN
ncbi:MAG TPA: PaaI family thioesterase [Casimicrobiaceae bacterium]|nr:PaaI family thioesterase [Casimicrobiaceae bacterium]